MIFLPVLPDPLLRIRESIWNEKISPDLVAGLVMMLLPSILKVTDCTPFGSTALTLSVGWSSLIVPSGLLLVIRGPISSTIWMVCVMALLVFPRISFVLYWMVCVPSFAMPGVRVALKMLLIRSIVLSVPANTTVVSAVSTPVVSESWISRSMASV